MRYLTAVFGVAVALGGVPASGQSEEAAVPGPLLCAPSDLVQCLPGGTCQRETADTMNVPRFFRIDFAQKSITGTRPDGTNLATTIPSVEQSEGRITLQGTENGRGWSIGIAVPSGTITVAVTGEDVAFVVFGACTSL